MIESKLATHRKVKFGFTRTALTIAAVLVVGLLFIYGAMFNGSTVTTTKVAAQVEFQGGATPEMLAYALNFGEASNLAVFGGRSINNRGDSVFRGDVGSAGKVTGVGSSNLRGIDYGQAKQDMKTAMRIIAQLPCAEVSDTELAGKTFTPGVYCLPSSSLAGTMTVNGGDDPNAIFVFRVAGTLRTDADSKIALDGGAAATNVYMVADDNITVGSGSVMNANLLSSKSISLDSGSTVGGKTIGDSDITVNSAVAGAGTGSVEICKALSPGDAIAVGTIFTFTVPGFADPIQVPAGSCSAPLDVAIGNQTITETARSNTAVISVTTNPANRRVSVNLPLRQVVVAVPEGGVTDQTIVTFTNQTTRTGTLEICKQGLDNDVTGFFQYTVEGAPGQMFSVPVGFCSGPITVTILQVPDTTFTAQITELARPNFRLETGSTLPAGRFQGIDFNTGFDANGNPITNTNGGRIKVTLIAGGGVSQQTTVNFFNRSLPGIVKICKITADPANIPVGTLFQFTVTGTAPTSPTQTLPGVDATVQVIVPAGPDSQGGFCQIVPGTWVVGRIVTVQEVASQPLPNGLTFADTRVSRITSSSSPFAFNLDNRTGAALARNTTLEFQFTNFVFRPAVLKVCKIAGAGVTAGTPFTFSLSAPNPLVTRPIDPTPFTVPAGSCVFAQGPFASTDSLPGVGTFNFGTGVTVTEGATAGVNVTAIVSPTGGTISPISLPNRTGTITLNQAWVPNSLFNEISFTNAAAAPPPPQFHARLDFDGDGKSDPVIFRPSNGNWWYAASSTGGTPHAVQWGAAGDKLVAADYDGDGITDYAVYRAGNWYVLGSSAGFMAGTFGTATDIPVPADYDGDGKADFAVYRPSEGGWYILGSSSGFTAGAFGVATDIPVPADYDGDGKTDLAVYRAGTWYVLGSTSGFTGFNWGVAGDIPVVADYDGDRKADPAVYRAGTWYILQTTGGFIAPTLGTAGDIPTPADYNGDGKTDISVYRPSTNMWIMGGQSAINGTLQFGAPGDVTVNY